VSDAASGEPRRPRFTAFASLPQIGSVNAGSVAVPQDTLARNCLVGKSRPTSAPYQVTAAPETFAEAPPVPLEVDGVTPKRDVVRVELGAQLVVDATGTPIASAVVHFERHGWSWPRIARAGSRCSARRPARSTSGRATASHEVTVEMVDKQRIKVVLAVVESSLAARRRWYDITPSGAVTGFAIISGAAYSRTVPQLMPSPPRRG
jgi:hypothetical protein